MKKIVKLFLLAILSFIAVYLILHILKKDEYKDIVMYKGNKYELLEYNMDIFTYNYNSNSYLEEDIIHPIEHKKWTVIYLNGDLFIMDKQVKKAIQYYSNDDNYEWVVIFNYEDSDIKKDVFIDKKEKNYLYNIESEDNKKTITFDEIDMFADIMKFSKDGLVQGIINLVQVDGVWYYKTEIMTEDDKEYVIPIIDSLNTKINSMV